MELVNVLDTFRKSHHFDLRACQLFFFGVITISRTEYIIPL